VFIFKPVENSIKEENEQDFVQLITECSPNCGKDATNSLTPRQNEPRHTFIMPKYIHLENLLSNDSVEPNRKVSDVNRHHSIGSSTVQDSTGITNEECLSLVLPAACEVSKLTDESADSNKHTDVGTSGSRGSSTTYLWENTTREIPQKSYSVFNYPKKHPCEVCGAKFRFPKDVRSHVRIHTGEKPFNCSFCDRKFRTKYLLQLHELRHTNELPQCDLCGGRFLCLQKHMRTHSAPSYKHTCSVCQKGFRVASKLKYHMYTHSDESERPYTCQDCGGRYKSLHHLKKHMPVHTHEKNHACVVCGKLFLNRAQVNAHMRLHTGEKPYHCETCGRTFSQRLPLTNHQRTHTKEKPFICTTCGKAFRQPSTLSRHELIHSGVQPYECSVCGMRFNQSNSMQRHMLTHTGEKPYSCSDCGQRFTQSGGLASHRRRRCPAKQHTDVTEGDAVNGQSE